MKTFRPRRPSPALVVATMALIVALGGTSYAAFSVPKNSVGTKQLRNGAVTTAKIKNGAVTAAKVANGTLTGTKIKASTLGTVPSAVNATNATNAINAASARTATTATNATNATNATDATNATNAANATTATTATTAAKLGQIFYRTASLTVPTVARGTGQASCPAGSFAVGGGLTSPDETVYGTDYLVDSHPTAGDGGWAVTIENESGGSLSYTVTAVCAPAAATG